MTFVETLKTVAADIGWLLLILVELSLLTAFVCALLGIEFRRKGRGDGTE